MKVTRTILNVLGILFLVFQVFGHIGALNSPSPEVSGIDKIAYYIGFNFLAIFGILFLLIARYLKKKSQRIEQHRLLESIGRPEES